ncbi:MAG: 1-acyl-sn-glycerol-3-phosphate acyltransferase [Treponema sp.]|jgi:1-acyl-sn-glycerol-3-phosphate acyltransferase|nr:1-acyl-sn-glycerol-3-phosphate acyltransferase [Treponema sp.]
MALFKTIMAFSLLVVIMMVGTPIGLLIFFLSLLGLKKPMSIVIYRLAQVWSWLLIACIGCHLTVLGREHIPQKGGLCFVSNHGSIVDILFLLALVGRPVGFIAKKELVLIPVLNLWIFLLGGLFIDRKDRRQALGTINTGINRLKAGNGMIIFPEGTRSKGQGLLPFHPGSLKLATKSGVPIVPVAIIGSYDVFEKTHRAQAVPVKVVFSKPIITADLPMEERKQQLADLVRGVIAEAMQR